jgi:hypothetical protein
MEADYRYYAPDMNNIEKAFTEATTICRNKNFIK